MAYHPLLDLPVVVLLSAIATGFTPAHALLRYALLPILCALTYHCVTYCPLSIPRSAWATSVGGYTLSYLFHYLDVGVLAPWEFSLQGPATDPSLKRRGKHADTAAARLRFGFKVVFSWRFLGTPYQPRNVPQLDARLRRSRARFLAHTVLTIAVCYLVLDAMDCSADPAVTETFYSLDKVAFFARIGDVSAQEAVMRFFAAVGLGAGLVAVQRGVYCVVAFVCVAGGVSEPGDWPPYNGPWGEICGLRRFWIGFWHQTNSHRFRVVEGWLVHDVMKVPRGGRAARWLRPWVVFMLSGVLHVAVDMSSGEFVPGMTRLRCESRLRQVLTNVPPRDATIRIWRSTVLSHPTTGDRDRGRGSVAVRHRVRHNRRACSDGPRTLSGSCLGLRVDGLDGSLVHVPCARQNKLGRGGGCAVQCH